VKFPRGERRFSLDLNPPIPPFLRTFVRISTLPSPLRPWRASLITRDIITCTIIGRPRRSSPKPPKCDPMLTRSRQLSKLVPGRALAARYDTARARAKRCAIRCFAQRAAHGKCIPCERDSPARFASSNATIIARSFLPLCACVLQASRQARELVRASLSSVRNGRGEEAKGESTGAAQCAR